MTLPLTMACSTYDRVMPLALGQVRPAGIDLTVLLMEVEEVFWRMTRHHEFNVAEMSMSSYTIRRSRGDDKVIAIPVFTSRMFRHSCIWVNAKAGIREPADLKGKKVGLPEYQLTANLWIRGLLEDEYGVKPSDIHWIQGGIEQPGRVEKVQLNVPGVEITPIGPDETINQLLATGAIDAVIGPRTPSCFDGVNVVRLFPDYRAVERDYFRRTGIFPIMHTVVIRRDVYDQAPWVARSMYDALAESKREALAHMRTTEALSATLPWLIAEMEETRALMGEDYWPYGLEPNRKALETLLRYSFSQGMAARQLSVDELFAPSTLDEFKI